ncbi:glycosyltransferase family 4 protein [Pleomorphovibrio marinus]|uniref:glycosyltransferase family 4 protein n=1 Tax=Pleomorphovibrio marinus TaxID=2164132 RepID=UPI000E0BD3A8|nr:glycosyltransferase family 4 protein [Pleomorphovibrio marinus]
MKVTIIANGFQEDYIHNLVKSLSEEVEELDFIGSDIYEKDRLGENTKLINLRGDHNPNSKFIEKANRIIKYYFKLINYLLRTDSKCIHIQWLRFDIFEGIFVPLLIRSLQKKSIYTAHNILPHNQYNYTQKIKYKIIYNVQSKIVVHTEYIKNEICSLFNIKPNKIEVIPHGVYEVNLKPEINKLVARRNLELPESKIIFLFFGRFSDYKGFDIIVDAVNKLGPKNEILILVAGRIIESYSEKFESLKRRCEQESFKFILKHVSEDEMEYCFMSSDYTIIPYKEASQSGVLFMSYAYGIPVIAANIGGFPEDIVEGKTGTTFQANSPTSLRDCLDQIVSEKIIYSENQRNNITQYAKEKYSWTNIAKKITKLYRS